MSKVKCLYCGKELDTGKDKWEKPRTNRYACADCCVETNESYMWDKVRNYARKQLGDTYNPVRVNSHIKNYKEKNKLKAKTVYQALVYWYEIQGASPQKANGSIGIVGSIWEEAEQYFLEKQRKLEQTQKYDIKDYVQPPIKTTVRWEPPVRPKKYDIIDLQ